MSLRARRMICHQFPRIKKIFPLDSVGDKNLMKYDEDPNTTLCEFCAFPRCILTLTRSSAGLLSVIHHRGPFPPPAQFEPPSIHEHPPLSVSGTNRTNSPALLYSAPSSHDSLFVIVHFVFHHLVPVVEPSSNSQQLVRGLGPSVSMTSRPVFDFAGLQSCVHSVFSVCFLLHFDARIPTYNKTTFFSCTGIFYR